MNQVSILFKIQLYICSVKIFLGYLLKGFERKVDVRIRWMLKENGDNLDKFLSEKGIGLNLDYESANSKKKNSSLNYIIIFERKYYSNRHFAYAILELQGE